MNSDITHVFSAHFYDHHGPSWDLKQFTFSFPKRKLAQIRQWGWMWWVDHVIGFKKRHFNSVVFAYFFLGGSATWLSCSSRVFIAVIMEARGDEVADDQHILSSESRDERSNGGCFFILKCCSFKFPICELLIDICSHFLCNICSHLMLIYFSFSYFEYLWIFCFLSHFCVIVLLVFSREHGCGWRWFVQSFHHSDQQAAWEWGYSTPSNIRLWVLALRACFSGCWHQDINNPVISMSLPYEVIMTLFPSQALSIHQLAAQGEVSQVAAHLSKGEESGSHNNTTQISLSINN